LLLIPIHITHSVNMSLISSVIGFGAFGFGARCFQLGLQKRNMFDGKCWMSCRLAPDICPAREMEAGSD
jgi:hypothetical protein